MNEQPEANQVPLVELLAAVPADVRIGVDDGNDWKAGTTWHPVGLLCHEAAAELRRLDAQRQWVGLTDEDFENAFQETYIMGDSDLKDFAKVIEAKLKEKNT